MNRAAAILLLFVACFWADRAPAQTRMFTWDAPTDRPVDYYVLFYGSHPRDYTGMVLAGHGTNFLFNAPLSPGLNYFALVAVIITNGVTTMSDFSNEVVLDNQTAYDLESVVFSSTNVDHGWTPFTTNRTRLVTALPAQFFRAGGMRIVRTNVLVAPPMP